MHIRFTNTDSTGAPVTKSMSITLDGERHTISVSGTGTARVPREVGEYLINREGCSVEPYEPEDESDTTADTPDVDDDEDDDVASTTDDSEDDSAGESEIEPEIGNPDESDTSDSNSGSDSSGGSVLPDSIAERLKRGDGHESA